MDNWIVKQLSCLNHASKSIKCQGKVSLIKLFRQLSEDNVISYHHLMVHHSS